MSLDWTYRDGKLGEEEAFQTERTDLGVIFREQQTLNRCVAGTGAV